MENVAGVVPDGVAKVTLLYPNGPGATSAAIAVTVAVVNNVYAAFVPFSPQISEYPQPPEKIVWHSRRGKRLKTLRW